MSDKVRWCDKPYGGYATREPIEPDFDLLQVAPATPAGEYLRRFWHPVAMSSQLRDRPVAVRILEEDLVVFRDLSGRVGLLHRHCAHRRASLEFGRIETQGIRCCYHGWHFDVDGTILETPGEPKDSPIRHKICQGSYPAREFKGLVFAYLGPPESMPTFPYMDSFDIAGHDLIPYAIHSPNNWLQETENAMDPFHSVFLHGRVNGPQFPGLEHFVELPVVKYYRRPEGFIYAHARRIKDLVLLRFHDYLMPNLAQNGGMFQTFEQPMAFGRTSLTKWVVPIDGINSRKFGWRHFNDDDEVLRQGNRDEVGWEKVDFYGQTSDRTYAERQSNPGDWDAWSSQGPMNVHQREYLGTTDEGVASLRSMLRRGIRAVESGKPLALPSGTLEKPLRTYGGDTVLRVPQGADDNALKANLIDDAMECYHVADECADEDRAEVIRTELRKRHPAAI